MWIHGGKECQTHIFFWCEFETYKILMSIQHTWVVSVQTWHFVTQVVWFCMHRTMKGHIWLLAARTWLLTGLETAENSLPSCCVMVTQLLYSTGDAHHPNHVAFLICQGYRLSLSSEHGQPLPLPQKQLYPEVTVYGHPTIIRDSLEKLYISLLVVWWPSPVHSPTAGAPISWTSLMSGRWTPEICAMSAGWGSFIWKQPRKKENYHKDWQQEQREQQEHASTWAIDKHSFISNLRYIMVPSKKNNWLLVSTSTSPCGAKDESPTVPMGIRTFQGPKSTGRTGPAEGASCHHQW